MSGNTDGSMAEKPAKVRPFGGFLFKPIEVFPCNLQSFFFNDKTIKQVNWKQYGLSGTVRALSGKQIQPHGCQMFVGLPATRKVGIHGMFEYFFNRVFYRYKYLNLLRENSVEKTRNFTEEPLPSPEKEVYVSVSKRFEHMKYMPRYDSHKLPNVSFDPFSNKNSNVFCRRIITRRLFGDEAVEGCS